jgi:hypothetical protein
MAEVTTHRAGKRYTCEWCGEMIARLETYSRMPLYSYSSGRRKRDGYARFHGDCVEMPGQRMGKVFDRHKMERGKPIYRGEADATD